MIEQLDVLEGAGDTQAGHVVGRASGDVLAVEDDPAATRFVQAADQIEDGGFAGAVGAHQGEHFAGLYIKADAVHRFHATEGNGQILNL